jgi:prepilin-type N-terminal cleavage/methylation domain-containing protein
MSQTRSSPPRQFSGSAFTLIELMVVISIIGALAALTVGLGSLASRKSKEARIRAEMTKLSGAIENYKAAMGFYPPDHRIPDPADPNNKSVGNPFPNQLFYELSGTLYNNANGGTFVVAGRQENALLSGTISNPNLFGSSGFANSARATTDLKFTEEFKANQYVRVPASGAIPAAFDALGVPVMGPRQIKSGNITMSPWLYVSTSPTNNTERYDLWIEVQIGGKSMRFSNWEKDPVVLQ